MPPTSYDTFVHNSLISQEANFIDNRMKQWISDNITGSLITARSKVFFI